MSAPTVSLAKETPSPQQRWDANPAEVRSADPIRLEAAFLLPAQRVAPNSIELQFRRAAVVEGQVPPTVRFT